MRCRTNAGSPARNPAKPRNSERRPIIVVPANEWTARLQHGSASATLGHFVGEASLFCCRSRSTERWGRTHGPCLPVSYWHTEASASPVRCFPSSWRRRSGPPEAYVRHECDTRRVCGTSAHRSDRSYVMPSPSFGYQSPRMYGVRERAKHLAIERCGRPASATATPRGRTGAPRRRDHPKTRRVRPNVTASSACTARSSSSIA